MAEEEEERHSKPKRVRERKTCILTQHSKYQTDNSLFWTCPREINFDKYAQREGKNECVLRN